MKNLCALCDYVAWTLLFTHFGLAKTTGLRCQGYHDEIFTLNIVLFHAVNSPEIRIRCSWPL